MATVEGKLFNADELPQTMVFYKVTKSSRPDPPGANDVIAGQATAGTNKMYSISLPVGHYHCWLPDLCGAGEGEWAVRNSVTPPHTVVVVEPYTWFGWRAPGCD